MSRRIKLQETNMFFLEMANYQENLLQTYRNIFIASQTIVVSIATLIVAFSSRPLNLTFSFQLIIGIVIIHYWKKITYLRGLDVSYCHMQIEKLENRWLTSDEILKPFWYFKNWQHFSLEKKEKILQDYDKEYKRDIFESSTRKIMGRTLPFIYSIVWGLILLTFVLTIIFS